MKKIFLALAAVAALAACSKSEVSYEYDREITFSAVTKNITKSMMEGTDFNEDEQFNVWAFYNPTVTPNNDIDAWVAEYKANTSKGAKIYVDEKPFEYHPNYSNWAGVTPYFWPKVGTLAFAGYYPTTQKNNVAYTLSSSKNEMTFTDIQRSWVTSAASNSEDLMYFNLTQCYPGTTAPVVTAIFKHALSWLTVNLSTDSNTTALGAKITVSSVKFTNVKPQGDAVVNNQDKIVWTPEEDPVSVEVVASPVELSSTEVQKQKEPLFIPQEMTGNLEITYTVSSPKDSEGEVSSFTETKVIALNTLKTWVPKVDDDGNVETDSQDKPVLEGVSLSKWEDAKHYIYNIVISTSEIIIDASVLPWDEVVVPVPVQ